MKTPLVLSCVLAAAVAALAGAPHARAQILSFTSDGHSSLRAARASDAPAACEVGPEFAAAPAIVPASWTASPARRTFAADLLAAPARTRRAAEAAATWLGTSGTVPAAPTSTGAGSRAATMPAAGLQPAAFNPSGAAYAWGNNNFGQLGNNTTTNSSVPVPVNSNGTFTNAGVTGVAAGALHSLAIQGGVVYAWGRNAAGALGNNSTANSSVPVPVSSANGFTNTGVAAVAAGGSHSLAIQGGVVYAWGSDTYGQLGNNSTTQSNVPVPVSSANGFINTGVTALAAGGSHSLALQAGSVYAWGYNFDGELGNNSTANSSVPVPVSSANGFTNTGVTAVAAGAIHSLAVQNGAVYAWGNNGNGQLGNNSTTQSNVPVAVLGLSTGVTGVAAGGNHSLALQKGNVFAWGYNGYGQLGNNSTTQSLTPVEVPYNGSFLSGIVQVAAGEYSSYALAGDGSLYVWGYNPDGELGLGTTTMQYDAPQHLLPPTGQYYQLIDSDGNGFHALAILGTTAPVPEPATWVLLGLGVAGLGIVTLRRRVRRA